MRSSPCYRQHSCVKISPVKNSQAAPYHPEVLASVGNWDICLAAVHNGAGAIYVGMQGFNARARSYDHSFDELAAIFAQAIGVHQWYVEKFKDQYPKDRKAIIPYIL